MIFIDFLELLQEGYRPILLLFSFPTTECACRSWVNSPFWVPKLMGQASHLNVSSLLWLVSLHFDMWHLTLWSFGKLLPQYIHPHWMRVSTWCRLVLVQVSQCHKEKVQPCTPLTAPLFWISSPGTLPNRRLWFPPKRINPSDSSRTEKRFCSYLFLTNKSFVILCINSHHSIK
jgi:hypothetical protein